MFQDDWPKMPDGSDFDGQHLLCLVRSGNIPFRDVWDINLLVREIEENVGVQVIDIPRTYNDSNSYALFNQAPDYEHAIRAGKDARHLWFALRE
ncbi:hypothetical protein NUU61_007891 [Penicillium alfredii]|uniref:Uncharacterized protein n=1 Tax=Penicillium alfredii TaxID=1506179 RepID=A0A9W9ERI9_9EURO|nr:uncharacterized protein NUU61_007891 [Penicillium alfredii]KAJ5086584.1 hypothetical protein NUU61_007891 [Penicillium alfredii]